MSDLAKNPENRFYHDVAHCFSAAGKSKGGKSRRQSFPQRKSSKVEDIEEDSENDENKNIPQQSQGRPPPYPTNLPNHSTHKI